MKEIFIEELKEKPLSFLFSKWLIERIPYIFNGDREKYIFWKEKFGNKIGVDSHAISFIGSACLGFSLNPNKNFQDFDDYSDVDIALISHLYFEISWRYLRNMGAKRHSLKPLIFNACNEHRTRLIYWGTIATDKILTLLPFGKKWFNAIEEMSKVPPTKDRVINVRIYKDFESLRAYQVSNLVQIRNNILSK